MLLSWPCNVMKVCCISQVNKHSTLKMKEHKPYFFIPRPRKEAEVCSKARKKVSIGCAFIAQCLFSNTSWKATQSPLYLHYVVSIDNQIIRAIQSYHFACSLYSCFLGRWILWSQYKPHSMVSHILMFPNHGSLIWYMFHAITYI